MLVNALAVLLDSGERLKVVPADKGIEVEISVPAEELAATAEASDAEAEDSTDACEEEIDDNADSIDDVKEAGGDVTGIGITTLPEVEAVKAVTAGALDADGAVPAAAETSVLVADKAAEELSVPVGIGRIKSVVDAGAAVVLSEAVGTVEAAAVVAAGTAPEEAAVASEADALERMLEKSDAKDAETAVSVAVAATLESCEFNDDAMLERALETSSVELAVAPPALVCVAKVPEASVVSGAANEDTALSTPERADDTRPPSPPSVVVDKGGVVTVESLVARGRGMISAVVELSVELARLPVSETAGATDESVDEPSEKAPPSAVVVALAPVAAAAASVADVVTPASVAGVVAGAADVALTLVAGTFVVEAPVAEAAVGRVDASADESVAVGSTSETNEVTIGSGKITAVELSVDTLVGATSVALASVAGASVAEAAVGASVALGTTSESSEVTAGSGTRAVVELSVEEAVGATSVAPASVAEASVAEAPATAPVALGSRSDSVALGSTSESSEVTAGSGTRTVVELSVEVAVGAVSVALASVAETSVAETAGVASVALGNTSESNVVAMGRGRTAVVELSVEVAAGATSVALASAAETSVVPAAVVVADTSAGVSVAVGSTSESNDVTIGRGRTTAVELSAEAVGTEVGALLPRSVVVAFASGLDVVADEPNPMVVALAEISVVSVVVEEPPARIVDKPTMIPSAALVLVAEPPSAEEAPVGRTTMAGIPLVEALTSLLA